MIDKSEYAKWLTSQMDFQARYHHHKETMAWVATALYVPGIIYLGFIFKGSQNVVVSVFLLVAVALFYIFVNMQFRMRWYAADVVAILMRRMAEFNRGAELPRSDEWAIDKEDDVWPHFVQQEINTLKEMRKFGKACIALKDLVLFRLAKVDNRWKTELATYLAIFLATAFSIYLVWN